MSNCTDLAENVNIVPPSESAPIVCVIDSGIQEQHKYLSAAIISEESVSLIPDNPSPSDQVGGGGHGTRVAGAVLYPDTIPTSGNYQLPCWIRILEFLMNIMGCRKRFIRLKLYQKPLKFIIKIILCRLEFTIIPLGVGNHVQ